MQIDPVPNNHSGDEIGTAQSASSGRVPIIDSSNHVGESVACYICGNDLFGINADARCPSCRTPVRTSLQVLGGVDADGHLNIDLQCPGCGYNVRGLALNGRCPECGGEVANALRGNQLQYCDPAWVDRLRKGLSIVVIGVVVGVAVGALVGGIGGFLVARGGTPATFERFMVAIALIAPSFYGVAAWYLTTPEPGAEVDLNPVSVAGALRYGSLVRVIFAVLVFGAVFARMNSFRVLLAIADGVLISAIIVLLLIHLRRIARRIPHKRLEWHGTILIRLSVPLFSAGALILMLSQLWPALFVFGAGAAATAPITAVPPPTQLAIAATTGIVGCGSAIIGLWTVIYIDRFRVALKKVVIDARRNWYIGTADDAVVIARPSLNDSSKL